MAYFDNASTTYPKPYCVYDFMDSFYRSSGANAGRGNYKLAQSAGALIGDTRKKIQELLHCQAKQVVFEPTATIALNIIIQGIIEKGAVNIYISPFEHNAVTRTLHHFEEQEKIKITQLTVSKGMVYDLEKIRYQFDTVKPDFVIVSHASNVFGLIAPVEDIFALAKKYEAITLVDMAQTAGLVDLNVGLTTIDFAVFAGHKTLYGPTGISGFVMNPAVKFPAVIFGGTGYESANQDMPEDLPQKYEMGTQDIAGIAGLNAALGWSAQVTIDAIRKKEAENRKKLIDLLSRYSYIKIIGNYSFFGKKCIEYPLERAIDEDKLTPYKYYPILVYLSELELESYEQLSYEMSKCMIKDKHGKYKLSKRGEILALKRSRVVAGAMQKLEALKREITPYKDDNNILVYCGATRVIDDSDTSSDDESDIRQIEAVTKILGNELNMNVARFTSEENMEERALIKEHFQDGGKLQAIVAIKCLDEGVNIPGIRTAFILASTTNPKEYIQRRGRVLRKAANKPFAEIYDFVTLPRPLDSVSGLTIEQANRDKTLVKNELARIKEFGRLALNSMLANNLIWDIQEAYHLNETDLEKEGEDFE